MCHTGEDGKVVILPLTEIIPLPLDQESNIAFNMSRISSSKRITHFRSFHLRVQEQVPVLLSLPYGLPETAVKAWKRQSSMAVVMIS